MRIEIISGSPRKDSITYRIAQYLETQLKARSVVAVGLIDVRDYPLPFVQSVWSKPEKVPAEFAELGQRMFGADGFILVSPEYNGGYSPALKNLLDHFPKQSRKAFGIATGTDGALGAARAAQQLIQMVAAFFGVLSPRLLLTPHADQKFSEAGELLDPAFQKAVDVFIDEYLWLAQRLTEKKE